MKLLPSEPLVVESALLPSDVLAAIPGSVHEVNCSSFVLGLRSEVDEDRILVGWWPSIAFYRAGIAFEGRVSRDGQRTVVSGDVKLFPRAYARLVAATLVLAGVLPLFELGGPEPWMGVLGSVWMFGGGRVALGVVFRAYRRRIVRALQAATAGTSPHAAF